MAGFFSPDLIERIRAASDVVDVIGSYLPLKRAGANFVALCPFHKEKSPSFNVNPQRQIFHCFGCHKGGDVFTFVKEYENVDFVEAVKRLADRAKIPIEYEQGGAAQETRHLKETLLKIHEQIAQRWHQCLLNEAAERLARRRNGRLINVEQEDLLLKGWGPIVGIGRGPLALARRASPASTRGSSAAYQPARAAPRSLRSVALHSAPCSASTGRPGNGACRATRDEGRPSVERECDCNIS